MIIKDAFGEIEFIKVNKDEPNDLEYLVYKLQNKDIELKITCYNDEEILKFNGFSFYYIPIYHKYKLKLKLNCKKIRLSIFSNYRLYSSIIVGNQKRSMYINFKEIYIKFEKNKFRFFTEE